jgi:hypothetical protein
MEYHQFNINPPQNLLTPYSFNNNAGSLRINNFSQAGPSLLNPKINLILNLLIFEFN